MSSLLAVLLVTQADQSSPSLVFAWPPRPKPTLRLDRPVYRPEQSRNCGGDLSFYSGKKLASHTSLTSDRNVSQFVSGLESDPYPLTPFHQSLPGKHGLLEPGQHRPRHAFQAKEDDDDSAPAQLFYEHHPPDSIHSNAQQGSTQSPLPTKPSYLGFEPDAWADMLTPRIHGSQNLSSDNPRGMNSGKKLELIIDALAIVAHPVLVNQKPTEVNLERSMERGRTRTRSGEYKTSAALPESSPFLSTISPHPAEPSGLHDGSSSESTHDELDASTLDLNDTPSVATTSSSSPPKPPPALAPISQLTRMMTPSTKSFHHPPSSGCAQTLLQPQASASIRSDSSPSPVPVPACFNFKPRYDPIAYSPMGGFPLAPATAIDDQPQIHETTSSLSSQLAPLQSFTLALIVDTPPASHLSQHLDVYYKDVVLKLTAALKHLERKSSYLTREVQDIMRKLADRRHSHFSPGVTRSKQVVIEEMMEFLEESCDLPRALARAFVDLKTLGSSSITLDQQLDLDLLLHRELVDSNTVSDNWLCANKSPCLRAGDQDRFAHLESWKSLLLLEDSQLLVEQTAPGSLLRDFITIIKPALTLSEYKFLLDTDSNTIAHMTDHLLYWRKAKITDMITLRNSYQLTCPPSLNKLPISTLQHEFSIAHPNLPNLVMILALVSQRSRQPFSNILPILDPSLDKSESMAVLVWLLKRDLVVRERTHVRIKIDQHTKLKVALWEEAKKQNQKGSDDDNYAIDEQNSLSPESQPRDGSNQAQKRGHINSSLSSDNQHKLSSTSSSLDKTTSSIQIQQQPVMSDQTFNSNAQPSSLPRGLNQRTSSYLGSQSLQPRSVSSIISSEGLSQDSKRKHQSLRSKFSNLSDRNQLDCHLQQQQQQNGEFDSTTTDGLLPSHTKMDLADSIIGEPGQATALEKKWLDEICTGRTDIQIRSFNLAFRYFNGRYPLEEIISRSGLSRKALNEVLIDFQSNLILLIHP